MPITTLDGWVQRIAADITLTEPFQRWFSVAPVQLNTIGIAPGNGTVIWRYTVPSMPSGVSAFVPIRAGYNPGTASLTVVQMFHMVDMGSLDISSNVFTDGAQMPTRDELGVSRQIPGSLWVEVETALNATPGTLTVTYKDQDGNAAEVSPSITMGNTVLPYSGCFLPLNIADVGVVDVTTAARAAGTTPTGTLKFYGAIPITGLCYAQTQAWVEWDLLGADLNPYRLEAGDTVMMIEMFTYTAKHRIGWVTFAGDTT